MKEKRKPKLAVWKFASCDGCQLSLLDCEDELLALAGHIEIAYFPEASRAVVKGPYDVSLVEGSITPPHDAERIHQVRRASKFLVTIGACASAGGIQGLRNFKEVKEFISIVYASPGYIETPSYTFLCDTLRISSVMKTSSRWRKTTRILSSGRCE